MCCRYIALPIETPDDRADFDDIRWYILHNNISVFVENGEWYIYIAADCRHLQPDYRCGIYETRPSICRKYTTENCDYHSGEYGWEQHFTCPEHLDEYVRQYFATNKKRSAASNGKAPTKRTGLKARPRSRRPAPKPSPFANIKKDIRGQALPVLEVTK